MNNNDLNDYLSSLNFEMCGIVVRGCPIRHTKRRILFLIYSVVSTFTTNLCVARELVKTKIFHLRIIYVLHENSKNRIPKRTKFSQKMVLSTKI